MPFALYSHNQSRDILLMMQADIQRVVKETGSFIRL